jgi:hypothetical protein
LINLVFQDRKKEYGAYQFAKKLLKLFKSTVYGNTSISLSCIPLINHFSSIIVLQPPYLIFQIISSIIGYCTKPDFETQKTSFTNQKNKNPETAVESAQLINPIISTSVTSIKTLLKTPIIPV